VRLFTRNGHDWTERYPLIVGAALRIKESFA
jgi:ATP-dependent DNA ligase